MARPLRIEFPQSFWHITHRGNERRPTFRDDTDRKRFLELLGEAVRRFKWIVTAYALMTNHFHLLIEITEPDTLSRGMHWLDGRYVSWFNRRHSRCGHLYQGRFGSVLVDKEAYFLELLRYVVLNPVRAALASLPEECAWTSYAATAGLTEPPSWLCVEDVLQHFSSDADLARKLYRVFVYDGIGSASRPWDAVVGGAYLGSEDWLERVRKRIESQPRDSEYPRPQRNLPRVTMKEIIDAVAAIFDVSEDRIRFGRGGAPRAIAAWIGCYEGQLRNTEIAAALRFRSAGHVTKLVGECERDLRDSPVLRAGVDRCIATLRRKK